MKIGLLTFHHSSNIGAMMQTYATCRALKELGHEVVIVDIRQPEKEHHGIKKFASTILFGKHQRDLDRFERDYYSPLTKRYYSVDELRNDPPIVDCLVVGSDQTWNPDISKEMSMAYFLDFGNDKIRRFSYASSFGVGSWERETNETISFREALHKFQNISVRERSGVDICRNTFGIEAKLVVDPTLLFKGYPEITGSIKERNELLCYKIKRNEDFFNNIGIVKKSMGISARLLNNPTPVKGLKYTYFPSVKEWIERVGGANFVLTDSFHGVAFSLNYERQFVVIRNHTIRDARFVDLLTELGLESRIYNSVEEMGGTDRWKEQIDYNSVNPKLEKLRASSWNYLKEALS